MADRRERCSWCGVQLVVPPEAQAVQCAVCLSVTKTNLYVPPLTQAQNSLYRAANLLKGLVGTVANNINSLAKSTGNSPGAYASNCGYYSPAPSLPLLPPSVHGRKRALLCGVTYRGKRYKLKGSVNDVRCMHYFLVEKMGFQNDSILILSEEETDPLRIPTKHNILMAMRWLVHDCHSGDSLVFHFSGHGSRQRDYDMDEIDGFDESLCPVDYEIAGKIIDDEINTTIVRPLPRGAKLHAVIDACYSGTMLDLPFLCRMNREGTYRWEDQRGVSAAYKGTGGGLALSISACDDNQSSADTTALSGSTATGAMTYSFIQAMQNGNELTYGHLLNAMRHTIREASTGVRLKGPIASLVNKVLGAGLTQEVQLSSSEVFDIYATEISL
ncbi:metacaspase-1-like [Syzygium oleosum]|uniref:metacaspase-1-like n=1 Tax=Syzygium oleosum TaxID=219896 RepID=UPI0011D22AA5|nr:metacaspase-1-like [Syzygium oleosum]